MVRALMRTESPAEPRLRYFTPWLLVLSAVWLAAYLAFFPHPLALAQKQWPLILVGVFGATIGNATAIGGGLAFIPVLMFVYHLDPLSSLKLAFLSQSVGMTSGATGWLRRGEVPLQLLRWTVPTLLAGALIGSSVIQANPRLVKEFFGPICLLAGIFTLATSRRSGGVRDLPAKANWPLAAIALVGGVITAWVAIGEGEIVAAFCMLAFGLEANRALGLGVVLLSINSIFLGALHGFYFGGVPWDYAIFTMLGCLWGGRLGPFLAQWLPGRRMKQVFAVVAIFDGLLIFLQALGLLGRH